EGDRDLQHGSSVFPPAPGLAAHVQAGHQVEGRPEVHALEALWIGEFPRDALGPPAGLDLPVRDLEAVHAAPEAAALADDLDLPLRAAGRHHPDEGSGAVVEGQVAVAHQVLVSGRLLVALHLAEDPAGLTTSQVADQVEHVAAVVRDARPAVGRDLEDRPDLAGVDQLADAVPDRVVVAGAVDRQPGAVLLAGGDHRVGL